MKSYSDAGYFGRNLRAIEVLIVQEKVRLGVGAQEAWKCYDLGSMSRLRLCRPLPNCLLDPPI
jgi:hypothetical protein